MTLFDDTSIFDPGQRKTTRFDLPDAELVLYEGFFYKNEADVLYTNLLKETHWKQEDITVYGKTPPTPRLTAWYGDNDKSYAFSGTKMDPYPWTPDLEFIKERIENECNIQFNSVLLNLYRNGADGVGWHRDNEPELGKNPIIGSVSFGETRPFHIRHKFNKELGKTSILLTHGSFLLMAGAMQHFWEHQIPKTAKQINPRINLTFRTIQ